MHSLKYKNIEEALNDLDAKEFRNYYTCKCPHCDAKEAFIYKSKPNFINCNRENKCGETTVLVFEEELTAPNLLKRERVVDGRSLTEEQRNAVDWVTSFFNLYQGLGAGAGYENPALEKPEGFRGLSHSTTKSFIADLASTEVVSLLLRQMKSLAPIVPETGKHKEYFKMPLMINRNIIIPIRNSENKVDAILLRSTINPNMEKKEIYLPLVPNPRMYIEEIPEGAETIIFAESPLDGLSFREIDPKVGLSLLTGSKKTRQLEELIEQSPEKFRGKNIIIAMDKDKAGLNAQRKLRTAFRKVGIRPTSFIYPKAEENDPNDLLQKNRSLFEKQYKKTLHWATQIKSDKEHTMNFNKEEGANLMGNVQEKPQLENATENLVKADNKPEFGVYIQSMTVLSSEKAIASIRYGDVNLNNIFIKKKEGIPIVDFPKEQGKDKEWRDVYTFGVLHEKIIESALIQNLTLLEHGIKKEIKYEKIPAKINFTEPKFDLRAKFDNKLVGAINYGSLKINNVWLNQADSGETKVSLPYKKNYATPDGNVVRYVTGGREFRSKIIESHLGQVTKTNEASRVGEIDSPSQSTQIKVDKGYEKEPQPSPSKSSLTDRIAEAKDKVLQQFKSTEQKEATR